MAEIGIGVELTKYEDQVVCNGMMSVSGFIRWVRMQMWQCHKPCITFPWKVG
jgi:hypothetical protein